MFFLGCHLVDIVYMMCGEPEEIIPLNISTNNDGINSLDYGFAVLGIQTDFHLLRLVLLK